MLKKIASLFLIGLFAVSCSSVVSPDNEPADLLTNPDKASLSALDVDMNQVHLAVVNGDGDAISGNAQKVTAAVAGLRAHVTSPPSQKSKYVTALHITGLHQSCLSVGTDIFCHITSGPDKSEYQNQY